MAAVVGAPRRGRAILRELKVSIDSFDQDDSRALFIAIDAAGQDVQEQPWSRDKVGSACKAALQGVGLWSDAEKRPFVCSCVFGPGPLGRFLTAVEFDESVVRDAVKRLQQCAAGGPQSCLDNPAAVIWRAPSPPTLPLLQQGCVDNTPSSASASGVWAASALSAGSAIREIAERQPFPIEVLPRCLQAFVGEAAESIGCDASAVALPLLAGMAATIGNTRRIRLKDDWHEPSVVWAITVQKSGRQKSPPLEKATEPLHRIQEKAYSKFISAEREHKRLTQLFRQSMKSHRPDDGQPADEPEKPTCERWIVSDTTIEALAPILQESPRGVLLFRDELSGWLRGFDQYKTGRGADAAQWLEMHRASAITVDRKGGEKRTIHVPRAAVSIVGTIQPATLAGCLGREHFDNGMAARFLLTMPEDRIREWSDRTIDPSTKLDLANVYERLSQLQPSDGEPSSLPLTSAAQHRFRDFVNQHGMEQSQLGDDRLEAAWSKLEGYAGRLALVIHMARQAAGENVDPWRVDEDSLDAGITLVRWFGGETKRVYSLFNLSGTEQETISLLNRIKNNGGRVTPRELSRSSRKYSSSGSAHAALESLVKLGLGQWDYPKPGATGGKPSMVFVAAADSADADQTPASVSRKGVLSATGSYSGGSVSAHTKVENLEVAA